MLSIKRSAVAAMSVFLIGAAGVSCVTSGGDSIEDFMSAVDSGADCEELFDQRENFDESADLERIDSELERIGCESPESERTD